MLRSRNPERAVMVVLAFALVAAGAAAPASAHHDDDHGHGPPECVESYRNYPGTGRACRNENGHYNVPVGNGKTLETHGPDAAETGVPGAPGAPGGNGKGKQGGGGGSTTTSAYYGGICTADGERSELIYAVAHDDVDAYADVAPLVRSKFVQVDNFLNSEAAQFGTDMRYKVRCDPDGQPTVHKAVLPTTSVNNFSYYSIVTDLERLGFVDTDVNYWVYFDERSYVYGGQANLCHVYDDLNYCLDREYAFYAVTYGYLDLRIFMHENGHNMGAVQSSAPNSSGGGHCNDGYDIMCYADGGWESNYRIVCGDRTHYDCNYDDYFHPQPPSGSYLSSHWNIASCINSFVGSSRCNQPPTVTAPSDSVCVLLLECSTGSGRAADIDGDMASWRWSFAGCPGACPALSFAEGTIGKTSADDSYINPARFTPSESGSYVIRLTVTDLNGNAGSDETTITVP